MISKNGSDIIKSKIGYRYEGYFSKSNIPSFRDMLEFEINELGNTDILITIEKLYNKKVNTIDEIIDFCKEKLDSPFIHYKWLCSSKADARKWYSSIGSLKAVYNSGKMFVISDLEDEGCLVISNSPFVSADIE